MSMRAQLWHAFTEGPLCAGASVTAGGVETRGGPPPAAPCSLPGMAALFMAGAPSSQVEQAYHTVRGPAGRRAVVPASLRAALFEALDEVARAAHEARARAGVRTLANDHVVGLQDVAAERVGAAPQVEAERPI